jgi:hypothetical protein
MPHASLLQASRRTLLITVVLAGPREASAQLLSSVDLSSRSARTANSAWQNQLGVSPAARLDRVRFSVDGRWTAFRGDDGSLTGDGALSATYFSPVRAGLQLSVAGFADRMLVNEALGVTRAGTDARLSYRRGAMGAWLGREMSLDNKPTPVSPVPRASAGAWRQWGGMLVTVSTSAFSTREGARGETATPATVSDTLTQNWLDTMAVDSGSAGWRRGWNDAEVALHWGTGRLAFRGAVGTRFFTANQPNETWGQIQGAYALAPDVALVASGGVHPSAAAYGTARARFLELGFRVAPSALLRPRLPRGVRPVAAAFEVANAERGKRTLRIRVPNARTVELSGDFTGWKPIALTRAGTDRWEATFPITAGMHRLAIRVDGDAWTPPPGVNAVPDEFQGTVGVIVVRD